MSSLPRLTRKIQARLGCEPDGRYGPKTARAVLAHLGEDHAPIPAKFPLQVDVQEFFGVPGSNQTLLRLPYEMRLAWDKAVVIDKFSINKACHDSALRIFERTLAHYGLERIKQLGLDLFAGCYNNRKMRGGDRLSMHAYAVAIDLDPARNGYRMDHREAVFAREEYRAFFDIVEEEGWTSLGRARDFDWMHIQAPRLD